MKYMQNGGFQNHPLMRLTLGLTLALLVGLWVTNLAMYFARMDLSASSVVSYYNGSEEDFRPPRSAASMLETTHMHLPMMGIVLLFLTHLLIFVPLGRGLKVGLILAAFSGAALQEAGGWLVRFVHPGLAPTKIAGFLLLQAALGIVLVVLALFLLRGARPSLAGEERTRMTIPSASSRA